MDQAPRLRALTARIAAGPRPPETGRMIGAIAPLTLSTAVLVLSNLLPLAGVLAGWWSVYEILLLYWAENLVIGLFQLARMATVLVLRREYGLVVMLPFFTIHYGGFALGHGLMLSQLFGPVVGVPAVGASPGQDLLAALDAPFRTLLAPDGLLLALLALGASHAFSFVVNFLAGGEWRAIAPGRLMGEPYGRVIVLHVVLIFGAWAVVALGAPIAAVALLVVVKIALDALAHRRRHRPPAPRR